MTSMSPRAAHDDTPLPARPRSFLFPIRQHLQGVVADGAQGVLGTSDPFRSVPGAQVFALLREGLDRQIGRGWSCGRCHIGLPLPGEENFKTLNTPETFHVPANSSFDLKIKTVTDYCCSYIEE